ncbi:hypothetical protein CHLRE_13g565270v5 [Chlamydomonas reinhardtii]|uniref:Uncharacterized protein n=3 Tax=Chlamydomonas reinhardtii TaxID=3055 RepID=A0A2K3CZ73_CHLRE|nr:uncharacterized protein CHLRE_13g565270v5 [Chlamydomonas reinhardtii]PNW73594.1 hypothetical protein CHLRE_13g565270v5 [Chlamydomonas reinhardtii]
MPEGSGITGKQDSARESASPSRGPGEQPGFASPASETPSYPVPNSFATWSLSPSSPECAINEAEWRECNPLFNQEGFDLFSSFLRKLRELRLKSGGPEGLGHMLMWMSGMEALLDSLFIGADVELNQHGLDEAKLDNAIALVQRQVRGLRAEHTARARAARKHSLLLDQLSGTVQQLTQQLNAFAVATAAVLEVETGGGKGLAPSAASSAAAAASRPAPPPGGPKAAAAPHAAPAAGEAARPNPPQPQACTHLPPPPRAMAANKILLRGASSEQAEAMARGDFSALGLGEGSMGMYERRWRASNAGRVWNVEVVVTRDQRAAFIRAAAQIKHTAGVTVAPFLTPEGRAARRARQAQFDSLVERGLQPYWRGTDIVTEEGDRRCVHPVQ